jgi:hypothetical protein
MAKPGKGTFSIFSFLVKAYRLFWARFARPNNSSETKIFSFFVRFIHDGLNAFSRGTTDESLKSMHY